MAKVPREILWGKFPGMRIVKLIGIAIFLGLLLLITRMAWREKHRGPSIRDPFPMMSHPRGPRSL
jgi:hypothetical protein